MFNNLPLLQNTISATSDAMSTLSADAQAFETDGYKQSRYTFASIFNSEVKSIGGQHGRYGGATNQNLAQGVTLVPMGYDMSQGGIKTASALNAAIDGQGFFIMQSENSTKHYLTRASDFIFASDGSLVDIFGRKVKGYQMNNGVVDKSALVDIKVDPTVTNLSDVGFETDGVLMSNYQARQGARESGDLNEELPEGTALFQLGLAFVQNPGQMDRAQGNSFTTTTSSGAITYFGTSDEQSLGEVIGGSSESSNVNPAETTIVGLQHQRGYNATQAALTMTNRFLTQLMEVVGKA